MLTVKSVQTKRTEGDGMILELTEKEQIVLLGLLEDTAQEDDIKETYPIQDRIALKSIIHKLGGTYFGAL